MLTRNRIIFDYASVAANKRYMYINDFKKLANFLLKIYAILGNMRDTEISRYLSIGDSCSPKYEN